MSKGDWKQAGLWARFLDRMIELRILGGWMGVKTLEDLGPCQVFFGR